MAKPPPPTQTNTNCRGGYPTQTFRARPRPFGNPNAAQIAAPKSGHEKTPHPRKGTGFDLPEVMRTSRLSLDGARQTARATYENSQRWH
jgi:hypothetical protein